MPATMKVPTSEIIATTRDDVSTMVATCLETKLVQPSEINCRTDDEYACQLSACVALGMTGGDLGGAC